MKRAATERLRTLRTWRDYLATHHGAILCGCDLQPGRFRKAQRIGGCGRSRCWLCHSNKLAGRATIRERRALACEQEGIAEVEYGSLVSGAR